MTVSVIYVNKQKLEQLNNKVTTKLVILVFVLIPTMPDATSYRILDKLKFV